MPLSRKTLAITWVVILISIPVIGVSCHFLSKHREKIEWRAQFTAERKAKAEAERKGLSYYDALRHEARERKYDSSITDSERLAGIEYQLTLLRIDQQEARARRTP